jgi:hypothetical protein
MYAWHVVNVRLHLVLGTLSVLSTLTQYIYHLNPKFTYACYRQVCCLIVPHILSGTSRGSHTHTQTHIQPRPHTDTDTGREGRTCLWRWGMQNEDTNTAASDNNLGFHLAEGIQNASSNEYYISPPFTTPCRIQHPNLWTAPRRVSPQAPRVMGLLSRSPRRRGSRNPTVSRFCPRF